MTTKELLIAAKAAVSALSRATSQQKNDALLAMAQALEDHKDEILAANAQDVSAATGHISTVMLDRLALSEGRISDMAEGIRQVVALPDPVGKVLRRVERPNGLVIEKTAVPMGVVAIIYESRPNVTSDAAALALKSGNVCVLRGGKEAYRSAAAIVRAMKTGLTAAGLPETAVNLVEDTTRQSATELMEAVGYVDLLIPRGGAGLIQSVVKNATVPVIETGAGTCQTYVDKDADLAMAVDIVDNAKTSRPSVCNACECVLVHETVAPAFLSALEARLSAKHVTLRADEKSFALLHQAEHASEADWGREYNDYILAVRVVSSAAEAIDYIAAHGTGHSECIVTENEQTAEKFLREVDAAAVYVNASTRFTDGGEFGLGAEIGISTQKLHARGPLGLRELTSYKYEIRGKGQVR